MSRRVAPSSAGSLISSVAAEPDAPNSCWVARLAATRWSSAQRANGTPNATEVANSIAQSRFRALDVRSGQVEAASDRSLVGGQLESHRGERRQCVTHVPN